MDSGTYVLKKYLGKSLYEDFNENLINRETLSSSPELNSLVTKIEGRYEPRFSSIELPEKSIGQLNELLRKFNLEPFINDFLWLAAISQYYYILYNSQDKQPLATDFVEERKDLEGLLQVLETYLFGNKNDLHSISFKYNTSKTHTVKNFFVVKDIYDCIGNSFGINRENFQERKQEILKKANTFKYEKGGNYIKTKIVQSIFNFLNQNRPEIGKNQALRFCGVFLHISQIPSNDAKDDVLVGEINDALTLIDHTNVAHCLTPRSSFFMDPSK